MPTPKRRRNSPYKLKKSIKFLPNAVTLYDLKLYTHCILFAARTNPRMWSVMVRLVWQKLQPTTLQLTIDSLEPHQIF